MTRLRPGHGPKGHLPPAAVNLRDTQCHRQAPAGALITNPSHNEHDLAGWGEAPLVITVRQRWWACGPGARDPSAFAVLAGISAAARRVVLSDPPYPIAVILSCATSARIFPFDRSTSSSSFGKNPSITPGRRGGAPASGPRPRSATYR